MIKDQGDIRAYLKVLWRWKLLILAIVLVIPATVFLVVSAQPKSYSSSTLMQIQPEAVDTSLFTTPGLVSQPLPPPEALQSAAVLVTTTGVAQEAAKQLGEPRSTARALLGGVRATADVDTSFITITSVAATAERAANVANAFAAAVVSKRSQEAVGRLRGTINSVSDQIDRLPPEDGDGRRQLSEQLQRLRALRSAQGSNAQIVEPAVAVPVPVAPQVTRTVVLSAVVAILLAFGAVMLAQRVDRRIRDPLELEELTNLPLLSAIPGDAFTESAADGLPDEAFQTLRASLTYFNIDRPLESVMIASPGKGDGKTTVATNLAHAMARGGKDVILVDADLRRPRVASRLHLTPAAGLGAVLVGEASMEEALVEAEIGDAGGGRLRVLTAGPPPPNPSELLASQRMRSLLEGLEAMSDLVVVDSTPLLTVSDSLSLVEFVSGTVVVARLNMTSTDSVKRLERVIGTARGTILGAVATGAASASRYGYYGYGIAPGPPPSDGSPKKRRRFGLPRRKPRSAEPVQPSAAPAETPESRQKAGARSGGGWFS